MMTLLVLIAAAILAIEISYESSLALSIKKFMRMDVTPQIIEATTKVGFFNKLFGDSWKYILFPITIVLVLLSGIYKKMVMLLNCPYCLSFHIGWISTYFYLGVSPMESIIYGLLTIGITHVIEKVYDFNG